MTTRRDPFLILGCFVTGLLALIVCSGVAVLMTLAQAGV